MKSFLLTGAAVCALGTGALAQVSGIGYTLAPRAAYLFAGDNSGLDNTFALGGDVGLSFGQFIELRGTYLQSIGGTRDFSGLGLDQLDFSVLADRDAELRRIGGDVKFNLSRGRFLPYLTVGTGIQRLRLDNGPENENIYGNAGVGFVLSAADRYTFFAEGRYTQYRNNALGALLTADEVSELGIAINRNGTRRVTNYSVEAGLAFYLGGRRPGEMTELDRAYANQFGDGFRSVSLELEPGVSRVRFDESLPYRDAYFGGGSIGMNFGPLVGVRGYYYQAMEDDNLNLDFDKLAMYGVDMRFNLNNVQTGLVPFLVVGGGYMDAGDSYVGASESTGVRSQGFATGGGGLVLGLGRNLRVRGSIKGLLMSGTDIEDIANTDQITTSTQYTIGIDLALGRRAKDGNALAAAAREDALEAQRQANAVQAQELRLEYEEQLAETEAELNEAFAAQDSARIEELNLQRQETEDVLAEMKARERRVAVRDSISRRERSMRMDMVPVEGTVRRDVRVVREEAPANGTIRMSIAEFEGLIEEIFESSAPLGYENYAPAPMPGNYSQAPGAQYANPAVDGRPVAPATDTAAARAQRENAELRSQLEQLRRDMNQMRGAPSDTTIQRRVAPPARGATNDPSGSALRTPPRDTTVVVSSTDEVQTDTTRNVLSKVKGATYKAASKTKEEVVDVFSENDRETRKRLKAERKAARKAEKAAEKAAKKAAEKSNPN